MGPALYRDGNQGIKTSVNRYALASRKQKSVSIRFAQASEDERVSRPRYPGVERGGALLDVLRERTASLL